MKPALAFHFDFISPFGYFASLRIEDLAARHGRTVEWHPMLLGVSVMKVMGLKPLLDTPLKGPYIERDVLRYAGEHQLPMQRRPSDPVMNPLPCGRALAWVNRHQPQRAAEVVHAIYGAYWGQGLDLSTPDSLVPVVGGRLRKPPPATKPPRCCARRSTPRCKPVCSAHPPCWWMASRSGASTSSSRSTAGSPGVAGEWRLVSLRRSAPRPALQSPRARHAIAATSLRRRRRPA